MDFTYIIQYCSVAFDVFVGLIRLNVQIRSHGEHGHHLHATHLCLVLHLAITIIRDRKTETNFTKDPKSTLQYLNLKSTRQPALGSCNGGAGDVHPHPRT